MEFHGFHTTHGYRLSIVEVEEAKADDGNKAEEVIEDARYGCGMTIVGCRRFATGRNASCRWHHACAAADKALVYQADKKDREEAQRHPEQKNLGVHREKLRTMKKDLGGHAYLDVN